MKVRDHLGMPEELVFVGELNNNKVRQLRKEGGKGRVGFGRDVSHG